MSQPRVRGCGREEEKVVGKNSSNCANAWGKDANKTEPGSFQWHLELHQKQWTHTKTQEVPPDNEEELF